jgi:hypothetical protein
MTVPENLQHKSTSKVQEKCGARHSWRECSAELDYICTVELILLTPFESNRLSYVCEILFSQLLGINFQIVAPSRFLHSETTYALSYGCSVEGIPELNSSSFFASQNPPQESPPIQINSILPGLYPQKPGNKHFDFDILASAFWILTDYWSYLGWVDRDKHGRVDDSKHPIILNQWHTRPMVHLYAQAISKLLPGFQASERKGSIQLTLDIDEPWKHAHKPWPIQWGGMAKAILSLDINSLTERIKSIFLEKDPFYIFPEIQHPQHLTLFFLLDRQSSFDGRHTWQNPAYQELIQKCQSQGYRIGIHPSYTSSEVPGRIGAEKEKLEKILGGKVTLSRQHFLKYRDPATFEELESCGISEEYSLCPIHVCGYLRGMAQSFAWYNLKKDQKSHLNLHPVMVMDRALQKYQGYTADTAWEKIKQEMEACLSFGGDFIILWHNTTLSETGEWKGWRKIWSQLQEYKLQWEQKPR